MTCDNDYDSLTSKKVKFDNLVEAVIVIVSGHSHLFNFMRFNINFKVFLRRLIRHKLMRGEVFRQINGTQGIRNMIDVFAFFGRCTVQDGTHHVPSDGLGIEAVVVPDDDATLAFQQLESRLSVFFHALVMVVAIHEDHVILAEMWAEVKGLRVAVELFYVGQVLAEETVQISV